MSLEYGIVIVAVLLLVSVVASNASGRLGVPALLIFLIIGMVAGSEGPGGIEFNDPRLAQWLGVVALAFILFSGGLDTKWSFVKPALGRALALSTAGVLMTALLVGWFCHELLGFPLLHGMLLGAIVSSTDAAAVFAVLRARGVPLRPRLRALLELESGTNDPMAVFLTVGLIAVIQNPLVGVGDLAIMFVQQMLIGLAAGFLFARLTVELINRIDLGYDGLYPAITTAAVLLTYGATAAVGGSGFLAVYVLGLKMGNSNFVHRRSLLRFHDGAAWLMQIVMFLTLGLLVFPSQLVPVMVPGLAVAAFLMIVARPVAVFLCLAFSNVTLRGRSLVGWVGLRGAVPIVLATFPLLAGVELAAPIFNLVFFVVLASILLQGTSLPFLAKRLQVDDGEEPPDIVLPTRPQSDLVTIEVHPASPVADNRLVFAGLPDDTLILLIYRGGEFFIPNGRTFIEAGDRLIILTSKKSVDQVRETLSGEPAPT